MMMVMINFRAAMSNWSLASLSRHGTTENQKIKKVYIPETARLRLIALRFSAPMRGRKLQVLRLNQYYSLASSRGPISLKRKAYKTTTQQILRS